MVFVVFIVFICSGEISKNHKILHEIFPAKIARILCQSIKVDAEHFEAVTCLYSGKYTENWIHKILSELF